MRVTAPHPFTGSTMFGPVAVTFEAGVADDVDLPGQVVNYLRGAGFTVDDGKPKRAPRKTADA